MHFALYDTSTGFARGASGPSLEWAKRCATECYGDTWDAIVVDCEFDNSVERVDITADPHVLVSFVPPQTPEQIKAEILAATQLRLDDFARTRNYDGIMSAATYATSTVEQFAAEGQRAVALRDQTWAALYRMLSEVQAGTRLMPIGYADIENELPALTWPA